MLRSFSLKVAGPAKAGPVSHVARIVPPLTSPSNNQLQRREVFTTRHPSVLMRSAPSEASGAPQGQVTGALMESMREKIAEALEVRMIG